MSDVDFINWPTSLLRPARALAAQVPFTRSGGRSLGGIARYTRTDKGFWRITLTDVTLWSPEMRREWNMIRTELNGQAGLVAVPCWSIDSAPYPSGKRERPTIYTHEDDTFFDDSTGYYEGSIRLATASYAPIGATTIVLRQINASGVEGIRFSYQHALYETGRITEQVGIDEYRVPIFPAVRAAIPGGAWLEVDNPTCLCRLADDRGMDIELSAAQIDQATVDFVEAVDVWNDLATESPGFVPTYEGADGFDFRYINNTQYLPLIF